MIVAALARLSTTLWRATRCRSLDVVSQSYDKRERGGSGSIRPRYDHFPDRATITFAVAKVRTKRLPFGR